MREKSIKEILNSSYETDKFIKENEKLIFKIIQSAFPSIFNHPDFEDYLQEGRLALYKAMLGFDESKGFEFSTYAFPVIKTKLIQKVKLDNTKINQTKDNVISLNSTISEDCDVELIDTLISQESIETKLKLKEIIKYIKEISNPRDLEFLKRKTKGDTFDEIAKEFNVTRQYVQQRLKVIGKKLNNKMR